MMIMMITKNIIITIILYLLLLLLYYDGHQDRHDHDGHGDMNVPKSTFARLEAPKPWHPSQDRENKFSFRKP